MHLSHLTEDLESWYVNFLFAERVETAFRPGLVVPDHTQTVNQGPDQASDSAQVRAAFRRTGRIGHSASIQTASRLQADVVSADVTHYPGGAAALHPGLDLLVTPLTTRSRYSNQPAMRPGAGLMAGLHRVVFNPSSDDFEALRNRLAIFDGVLPGGTLPLVARSRAQGFNSILATTHRQNFLVPPRRHRSFPLVEL